MATITDIQLAAAMRLGDGVSTLSEPIASIVTRLNAVGKAYTDLFVPLAPEAIQNEAVIRFASYLYDSPTASIDGRYSAAWHYSGAYALTAPFIQFSLSATAPGSDSPGSGPGTGPGSPTMTPEEITALVRQIVAIWAEQGNISLIPAAKIPPLPASRITGLPSGGLDRDAVNALISAGVANWAEEGNAQAIPITKIPSNQLLPAPSASKWLQWNSGGTALINVDAPSGGVGGGGISQATFNTLQSRVVDLESFDTAITEEKDLFAGTVTIGLSNVATRVTGNIAWPASGTAGQTISVDISNRQLSALTHLGSVEFPLSEIYKLATVSQSTQLSDTNSYSFTQSSIRFRFARDTVSNHILFSSDTIDTYTLDIDTSKPDLETFARVSSTDTVPTAKLPTIPATNLPANQRLPAPSASKWLQWNSGGTELINVDAPSGGGGLTNTAVNTLIQAAVDDWAETRNASTLIPVSKIPNLPASKITGLSTGGSASISVTDRAALSAIQTKTPIVEQASINFQGDITRVERLQKNLGAPPGSPAQATYTMHVLDRRPTSEEDAIGWIPRLETDVVEFIFTTGASGRPRSTQVGTIEVLRETILDLPDDRTTPWNDRSLPYTLDGFTPPANIRIGRGRDVSGQSEWIYMSSDTNEILYIDVNLRRVNIERWAALYRTPLESIPRSKLATNQQLPAPEAGKALAWASNNLVENVILPVNTAPRVLELENFREQLETRVLETPDDRSLNEFSFTSAGSTVQWTSSRISWPTDTREDEILEVVLRYPWSGTNLIWGPKTIPAKTIADLTALPGSSSPTSGNNYRGTVVKAGAGKNTHEVTFDAATREDTGLTVTGAPGVTVGFAKDTGGKIAVARPSSPVPTATDRFRILVYRDKINVRPIARVSQPTAYLNKATSFGRITRTTANRAANRAAQFTYTSSTLSDGDFILIEFTPTSSSDEHATHFTRMPDVGNDSSFIANMFAGDANSSNLIYAKVSRTATTVSLTLINNGQADCQWLLGNYDFYRIPINE